MGRKCIIGQSGGPTVAINATLAGVIEGAFNNKYSNVYGMVNGMQGLLNRNIVDLEKFKDKNKIDDLMHTPAMFLGSCRFKISGEESMYSQIIKILNEYEIDDFFYIGGNDSMDTIKQLNAYGNKIGSSINFIGVPKTIDNDLMHTDYTPGYPSACKYVATSLLEVAFDNAIYPMKSVMIVEIMGRDAGWLTASAAIVNEQYPNTVDLIYMPETVFNKEEFVKDVQSKLMIKDSIIIAVSEGIKDETGNPISFDSGIKKDAFGHMSNNGCSGYLKQIVATEIDVKVRAIELSTLQRCAAHLSSVVDLNNSKKIGNFAVECALKGISGDMICIEFNNNEFVLNHVDVNLIANYVKEFPLEWIDNENRTITKEYIDYIIPLVFENGSVDLPRFVTLND